MLQVDVRKRGPSWVVEVDGQTIVATETTKEGAVFVAVGFAHANAPSRLCTYQTNGKLDGCADLQGNALPPPPTGPVPTTVRFDVDALVLPIDGTERMIARLYDQHGQIIPTQDSEWTFTAAGPVQYADHAVTGMDTGTALIGARHNASGLAGLAEITVTEGDMPTRRYDLTATSNTGDVWGFVFRRVTGDELWFDVTMVDDDGNSHGPCRMTLREAGGDPGGGTGPGGGPVETITARLDLVSGDGQAAEVGQALPAPVVVRVTDELTGEPIEGYSVTFVPVGSDTVQPASTTTDPEGLASTTWTLQEPAGGHTLSARLPGSGSGTTAAIAATALASSSPAPVGSIVKLDGDGQVAEPSTALPQPVRVLVRDAAGTPVSGVGITWTPSSGSVSDEDSETDASGIAQATWTLGTGTGARTLQVDAADDYGSVTFGATAAAAPSAGVDLTTTQTRPSIGPLILQVATQADPMKRFDVVWAAEEQQHYTEWLANKGSGVVANHYGAFRSRLQWALRKGLPTGPGAGGVYARGREILLHYLTVYSGPAAAYNPPPHNNTALADIEALYRLEATNEARLHIWGSAQQGTAQTGALQSHLYMINGKGDPRQMAVPLQAIGAAIRLGIPYTARPGSTSGFNRNPDGGGFTGWQQAGERLMTEFSKNIQVDGTLVSNAHGTECYWMSAMVATEYLRWHGTVAANATAVEKATLLVDHLITVLGSAAALPTTGNNSTPSNDTAAFYVWPSLVLWQETADAKYRTFALTHLNTATKAWVDGVKQWNQMGSTGAMSAEALLDGVDWTTI